MYLPQNKLKDWRVKHKPKSCPLLLRKTSDWVVDHCHKSGMVRGADYLEQEQLDVLHPVGLTQLSKRFKSLTSEKQKATLVDLGAKRKQLMECSNASGRTKLFRELTKHKHE